MPVATGKKAVEAGHPSPLPRWFHPWAVWLAGGKKGRRPATAPVPIPRWAWELAPGVVAAIRAHSAPPPPVMRPLEPPFDGRGAFTAWGFESGEFDNVDALAADLADAGFSYVLPQLHEADPAIAAVFHDRGLKVVPWGIVDADPAVTVKELVRWDADGFVPQVEGPGQRDSLARLLSSMQLSMPLACVTTGGGIGDIPAGDTVAYGNVEKILSRIPLAIMECYEQDDPGHANVQVMCWQIQNYRWTDEYGNMVAYGFRQAKPVIGLYHGIGVDAYLGLRGAFDVWNVESMQKPADFDAVKEVAA